jgi:hypothetical protein
MRDLKEILAPVPYHKSLRDYFKTNEKGLWKWISSAKYKDEYFDSSRLELLKSTYRLDKENYSDLYSTASKAASELELDVPVTLYQGPAAGISNVALLYIPGEAHIVFSGKVIDLLDTLEIKAIIGHELAHYKLFSEYDEEFLVTERILNNIISDPRARPSHVESSIRFSQYMEIYADRGSLQVTGQLNPVVSGLVKIITGLEKVSAESYIAQSLEIFSKENVKTEELSHPELFIRTRALHLWNEDRKNCNLQIQQMIEGKMSLFDLDLTGQCELTSLTNRFLKVVLKPVWYQTDLILSHARIMFDDFVPPEEEYTDNMLFNDINFENCGLRDYFSFLLLDFIAADDSLEDTPIAWSLKLAQRMKILPHFRDLANKELGIKKRDMSRIEKELDEMLDKAEKTEKEQELQL